MFLDGNGRTILDHVAPAVGSLQIGGSGSGHLRLGHQAQLPVTSNLVQSSNGTLQVELAGNLAGQFGRLQISGQAQLSGMLQVTLVNSFAPSAGQSFEILTATGGVSQTFQQLLLPALAPGLEWDLSYGSRSVLLQVISTVLPGDYNRDGLVDAADYVVWRKAAGQQVTPGTGADGNNDGWVDDGDFSVWKSNFGNMLAGGAAADDSAVPEPGIMMLAASMIYTLLFARAHDALCRCDYMKLPIAHRTLLASAILWCAASAAVAHESASAPRLSS